MIRQNKYLLIALIALCSIAWAACTQQRSPCLTPKTANFTIETMHLPTDTSLVFVDTALQSAVFIALARSLVADPFAEQSTFGISLSSDTTFCRWLFRTDTFATTYDTLSFFYKRIPQFLSNACSFIYFYTIDTVITTRYSLQTPQFCIDSVRITNPNVTNDASAAKNLQIFIHHDF